MIYLFDKDEKLIKIIRKPVIKTALQKFSLTTENYVSDRLTVEMKALRDDELAKLEYMAIQSIDDAHILPKGIPKGISQRLSVFSLELRNCVRP